MKRYSAITIFNKDLDRVVLIEKQKPAWHLEDHDFARAYMARLL